MLTRQEQIDRTRKILDWFEARPQLPLPTDFTMGFYIIHAQNKQEFLDYRRTAGCTDKTDYGDTIGLTTKVDGVSVEIWCEKRHTCKRLQVGEVTVPAEPAKPERVVPKYEWQCSEPLLATEPMPTGGPSLTHAEIEANGTPMPISGSVKSGSVGFVINSQGRAAMAGEPSG